MRCLGDLTLADVEYGSLSRVPSHSHERAYFCLIRQGTYVERYSRWTRICRPKMLVFHPPGEGHRQTFGDEPVLSFNVELGAEWLDRIRELGGTFDQPIEFRRGKISALCEDLFQEFARGEQDSELSLESLTSEILAAYIKAQFLGGRTRPDWLTRGCQQLDASFNEPLSLGALANKARIHPIHFAAVFRRFNGCSVGEYLRRRRIKYASELLGNPEISLAQIAQSAGFADQSHFTRTYKRYTGRTPSQQRTFLMFKTRPNTRAYTGSEK